MSILGSQINRKPKILKFMPAVGILRIAPAVVLLLAGLALSCHKRPPKTTTPSTKTQPTSIARKNFELGEARYAAGDFGAAASFYEAYLRSGLAKDRDLTLFHLGLAHALQGATPENLEKSQAILQQLVQQYPATPYLAETQLLLSLQEEIKRRADAANQKQVELNGIKVKQQSEIDRLKNEVKEQQARIKTLTEDLQRLRDIDMERRPSRPAR